MPKKKEETPKELSLQEQLDQAIGMHNNIGQALDRANEQTNQLKTELLRTEGEIRLLQKMIKLSTQTE